MEDNLKPEEDAPSITQEIQTLEEYKGDVVNILVCGIDYEEGRNYSDSVFQRRYDGHDPLLPV